MSSIHPEIFVVDDDIIFHRLLSVTLEEIYPGMSFFSNGESFLEKISNGIVPDLVVLDFNLGSMTGLEILRKARKLCPDLKVVVLSAQEDVEVAVKVIKAGAYDYIVKNSDAMSNLKMSINCLQESETGFLTWN